MILLVLCILALSPAPPDSSATLLVADELDLITLDSSHPSRVLVRYGAQVGTRLEVEGSNTTFALPEGENFPALSQAKGKRGLMVVEVTRGKRGDEVNVLSISQATSASEAFATLMASAETRSIDRLRAVFTWAFREANRPGHGFLEQVVTPWKTLGEKEATAGRERALAWLHLGVPTIGTDARWIEFANTIAKQYEGDPTVIAALEDLDLIETESHWRPRSLFLTELGLIDQGDEVITVEQSDLRDRIASWRSELQQSSLLRGRTTAQYKRHVQAHEVVEGMEREEVVLAWGYPTTVTWRREGKTFYEGWYYGDKEVFFVDGWVFASR